MKERIGALIGGVVEGMQWLGTFHSIGARMLRRHAELAGLKSNFTILDADDQLRLHEAARRGRKYRREALASPDARKPDRRLEKSRAGSRTCRKARRRLRLRQGRELYRQYQERLKSLNAADFGDLLLDTLTILRTQPDILADYRERFRYILVDEYQDTNVVQYLWLKLLGTASGNVCVVGDDDQIDLCLARRGSGKHPALRARFSGRQGDPAGAQLPLDALDFGRSVGLDCRQQGRVSARPCGPRGNRGEKIKVKGVWDAEEEARNVASRGRKPASRRTHAFAEWRFWCALVSRCANSRTDLFRWVCLIASSAGRAFTSARKFAMQWPICA